MFLLLFSGYLLFDYYPESVVASTVINTERIKVTITELLVVIFVFIYLIDEIREVFSKCSNTKTNKKYDYNNILNLSAKARLDKQLGQCHLVQSAHLLLEQMEHLRHVHVFALLSRLFHSILAHCGHGLLDT